MNGPNCSNENDFDQNLPKFYFGQNTEDFYTTCKEQKTSKD